MVRKFRRSNFRRSANLVAAADDVVTLTANLSDLSWRDHRRQNGRLVTRWTTTDDPCRRRRSTDRAMAAGQEGSGRIPRHGRAGSCMASRTRSARRAIHVVKVQPEVEVHFKLEPAVVERANRRRSRSRRPGQGRARCGQASLAVRYRQQGRRRERRGIRPSLLELRADVAAGTHSVRCRLADERGRAA